MFVSAPDLSLILFYLPILHSQRPDLAINRVRQGRVYLACFEIEINTRHIVQKEAQYERRALLHHVMLQEIIQMKTSL